VIRPPACRATARSLIVLSLAIVLMAVRVHHADGQSAPRAIAPILIQHEFNESNQGWRLTTDTGSADADFAAAGGDPGGCIAGSDEEIGETWYFRAPLAVLQHLRAAENGVLRFSLRQSTDVDGGFLDEDVVIVGETGRLGYRFGRGSAPGTAWKQFSVRLSASAGWTWNGSGPATQAQIRSVLAAPLSLEIRGEYTTGPDEGFLDNFELQRPDVAEPEGSAGQATLP
jgi:hypothetical protein